jgi:uncharacterized coiled-coil protein SlyX
MTDPEQRLERTEAALAHLEHQYDQLNGVVVEQARLVERLRKQVERLSESIEAQEMDRIRNTNTKPPHYSV